MRWITQTGTSVTKGRPEVSKRRRSVPASSRPLVFVIVCLYANPPTLSPPPSPFFQSPAGLLTIAICLFIPLPLLGATDINANNGPVSTHVLEIQASFRQPTSLSILITQGAEMTFAVHSREDAAYGRRGQDPVPYACGQSRKPKVAVSWNESQVYKPFALINQAYGNREHPPPSLPTPYIIPPSLTHAHTETIIFSSTSSPPQILILQFQ